MSSETVANTSAVGSKTCHVCGTDVSRKARQKDDKGRYYCVACANSGEGTLNPAARERKGKVQCPDCGQYLPKPAMTEFEGTAVCDPCRQVRVHEREKALERREQAARGGEEEKKQRSRLLILLIIAGALGALTIYSNFFVK